MNEVFKNYSQYYNLLYKDKDYKKEADYIADCLSGVKNILELGCGTGKHAYLLKQKGYDVFGIDFSKGMLSEAKKLGIKCKLGDVRTFRTNKKFDAVISLFHIASYQNTNEDIMNFFKTAAFHLEKSGKFIFDLWYKPAVLHQLPKKRIKEMEDDEIKIIRHCIPNHIKDKNIIEVNYYIKVFDKNNKKTEKIAEKHSIRYFSGEDIEKFAKQSGFKIIKSEELVSKASPSEKTWGVCFMAEKL